MDHLEAAAREEGLTLDTEAFAQMMDARDPLRALRSEFEIPTAGDVSGSDSKEPSTYLCGNSLGLLPRRAREAVSEELNEWGRVGVVGHHRHSQGQDRAWIGCRDRVAQLMAPLVGADAQEVGLMGSLTVTLHVLLAAFYQPSGRRTKLLLEDHAFPSDHYVAESQAELHGLDPASTLVLLTPRTGEHTLRTEDILRTIDEQGDEIAVLMLSGIQYFTGQLFDIARITEAAHARGCVVGWDLAHAAGNVPLQLHDWGVDFASWCTYKYMNSGPGGIAGFFVHQRHGAHARLRGWWGHDPSTRFNMTNRFEPAVGAAGYELSNTPVLLAAALRGSLEVFAMTSIGALRAKSELLTAYLEHLLYERIGANRLQIITPRDPTFRGAQLSVLLKDGVLESVVAALEAAGVVCDERKPNVIRIAPAPLYNGFCDVWRCVDVMRRAIVTGDDSSEQTT
ncbi:Kynureninase (L-kynurenine hydrolase) [Coemansia sp. Benny D115]|nr:Kynureninase (L-kynurenine hydrolase) [Coemansia sp. Benny D115]